MTSAEFKRLESGPSDQGTLYKVLVPTTPFVLGRSRLNSQLGNNGVLSQEVNKDEEFDFPQKIAQGEG